MKKKLVLAFSFILSACSAPTNYVPDPPHVKIDASAGEAPDNLMPVNRVPPFYPQKAFEQRVQGYVIVEYDILPDGRVVNPRLVEENPEGYFSHSALITVQKYKYENSPHGYKNVKSKLSYAVR